MKYIEGYLFSKGARGSTCEASLTPLNPKPLARLPLRHCEERCICVSNDKGNQETKCKRQEVFVLRLLGG